MTAAAGVREFGHHPAKSKNYVEQNTKTYGTILAPVIYSAVYACAHVFVCVHVYLYMYMYLHVNMYLCIYV